jgi:hypothetical protein
MQMNSTKFILFVCIYAKINAINSVNVPDLPKHVLSFSPTRFRVYKHTVFVNALIGLSVFRNMRCELGRDLLDSVQGSVTRE